MKLLKDYSDLRIKMGKSALKRALENFEAERITKKLEALYLEELEKLKSVMPPVGGHPGLDSRLRGNDDYRTRFPPSRE